MFPAQSEPRADALTRGLSSIAFEQQLLEGFGVHDRRIADRVHAGGNRTVDLSERDLVAHRDGGLETRAASALQVESGGLRGEARAEHGFTRQVPLARMLHHRAGPHLVDPVTA